MNPSISLSTALLLGLGHALLHSLWQQALLAGAVAAALAVLREQNASLRYRVAGGGIALMVLVFAATFASGVAAIRDRDGTGAGPGASSGVAATVVQPFLRVVSHFEPQPATPEGSSLGAGLWRWVTLSWMATVVLLFLRLVFAMVRAPSRFLRRASPASLEQQWRCGELAWRLGIRRPVPLLESPAARVPTTFGFLRPVVLLPHGVQDLLSPEELEGIVAHELAHVRRGDYLTNLCFSAAGVLLFHHPATHWLSNRIRIEREYCCDDLAIAVGGGRAPYLRALARMERFRDGVAALAAGGGDLLGRMQRLVQPAPPPSRLGLVAGCFIVGAAITVAAAGAGLAGRTSWAAATPPMFQSWNTLSAALGSHPPGVYETLGSALRHSDWEVRNKAAVGLGDLGDARAVELLARVLAKESVPVVRQSAAWSLGRMRDDRAVEPLTHALQDRDADVRWMAGLSLGQIGGAEARRALHAALQDPHPLVRRRAAEALAATTGKRGS